MSQWENQVKVSLNDIFDDGEDDKQSEKKDTFPDTDDSELEDLEDKINDFVEYDTTIFSRDEQIELKKNDIAFGIATRYNTETSKKPIWNKKITKKFKTWLENNDDNEDYPMNPEELEMYNLLLDEKWKGKDDEKGRFELDIIIKEQIEQNICTRQQALYNIINAFHLDEKLKQSDKKEKKFMTPKELKSKIKENSKIKELMKELTWLYNFMPNLEFVDYVPNDDDMKRIEKIDLIVQRGA